MDVTKPCEFMGFGAIDGPKPYEFIGFGAIDGPNRKSARRTQSNLSLYYSQLFLIAIMPPRARRVPSAVCLLGRPEMVDFRGLAGIFRVGFWGLGGPWGL